MEENKINTDTNSSNNTTTTTENKLTLDDSKVIVMTMPKKPSSETKQGTSMQGL